MEITEVRVRVHEENRLKGYASVTFDDCFVVRNIRLVQSDTGVMICMPSRRMADGRHKDVAHPITNACRRMIEEKILSAYTAEQHHGA